MSRDQARLLVLLATSSPYSQGLLREMLGAIDLLDVQIQGVRDAQRAEVLLDEHPGACMLVIDSGLLEQECESRWTDLRDRRAELAIVARVLEPELARVGHDERHHFVRPDDAPGLLRLIRASGRIARSSSLRCHWTRSSRPRERGDLGALASKEESRRLHASGVARSASERSTSTSDAASAFEDALAPA